MNKRGFTLIELMVTVSIISILTVVGIMNYQATLKKARDSRRQADLEQIRGALELYRSDEGVYPTTLYTVCTPPTPLRGPTSNNTYMTGIPCDPSKKTVYGYVTTATGYQLGAILETSAVSSPVVCSTSLTGKNYCVTNP